MRTQADLQNFLRENKNAWPFVSKATDDYMLARCGMLNALWSSFEMATQAAEKLLKGYLLFADQMFVGDTNKMRDAVSKKAKSLGRTQEMGHDVEACLELAIAAGLQPSADLRLRLARINSYYSQRYPDSAPLQSLSTKEIEDVDEAMFEIWGAFKTINDDYYYITGLSTPIYASYKDQRDGQNNPMLQCRFQVLSLNNRAYQNRQSDFEAGIEKRLTAWYPIKSTDGN